MTDLGSTTSLAGGWPIQKMAERERGDQEGSRRPVSMGKCKDDLGALCRHTLRFFESLKMPETRKREANVPMYNRGLLEVPRL